MAESDDDLPASVAQGHCHPDEFTSYSRPRLASKCAGLFAPTGVGYQSPDLDKVIRVYQPKLLGCFLTGKEGSQILNTDEFQAKFIRHSS